MAAAIWARVRPTSGLAPRTGGSCASSRLERCVHRSFSEGTGFDEHARDLGGAGAQPLPEGLGLRVESQGRRGAGTEEPGDYEVDGAEVAELVARDREVARLGQQTPQLVDGQRGLEPLPGVAVADPDAEVGVAPLVARPGVHDLAQCDFDELVGPCRSRRGRCVSRRLGRGGVCAVRRDQLGGPVVVVDRVVDRNLVQQGGPVDAECRPRLGRTDGVQPGIAAEREFDDVRRERPSRRPLGALHGDPQQRGPGVLGIGVVLRLADAVDGDGVDADAGFDVAVDGSLHEGGLGVEIGAGQREEHVVLPASDRGDRHLGRRRWRRAADPADLDAVVAEVGQLCGVEVGDHVGVQVGGLADLVEQLRLDGVLGDGATGSRVLRDHRGAVGGDLRDGEPRLLEVGDAAEAGEVAAGGLRAAFDDMSGAHRAGEGVVVVGGPGPPPGGGTDDQGRIGDATGDDDVGAVLAVRGRCRTPRGTRWR